MSAHKQERHYVLPYPKVGFNPGAITLSTLYENPMVRDSVRVHMANLFQTAFESVLSLAKRRHFHYLNEAIKEKSRIEYIFIEYGLPLQTLEDLKFILATLPEYQDLRKHFPTFEFVDQKCPCKEGITDCNGKELEPIAEETV